MRRGGVDESRSETVLRPLRTIPPLVLGLLLVTALLPALLVVGLAIDLGRWGWPIHSWLSASSSSSSMKRMSGSLPWAGTTASG